MDSSRSSGPVDLDELRFTSEKERRERVLELIERLLPDTPPTRKA